MVHAMLMPTMGLKGNWPSVVAQGLWVFANNLNLGSRNTLHASKNTPKNSHIRQIRQKERFDLQLPTKCLG